jgi:hypothetical protein
VDVFDLTFGEYRVTTSPDKLPSLHNTYHEHAALSEQFELNSSEGAFCFVAIGSNGSGWPELAVSQRYEPAGYGFNPGAIVIPETKIAFIGAGTRLLAYRLQPQPQRLWIDHADAGFWGWQKHGSVVVMSAELELAAWSTSAEKLWSIFVEPPWSYTVSSERTIHLDVMGKQSSFPLVSGPAAV